MKVLCFLSLLLLTLSAHSRERDTHGGDICENNIISVQNDLESWVIRGGHRGLKLPKVIPYNVYKTKMLDAFESAIVSCTKNKLSLKGLVKSCLNISEEGKRPKIICNREIYMSSSVEEQYRLIHHEYAGISGFETSNNNGRSNYKISDQISAHLEAKIVKKLAVNSTEKYTGFDLINARLVKRAIKLNNKYTKTILKNILKISPGKPMALKDFCYNPGSVNYTTNVDWEAEGIAICSGGGATLYGARQFVSPKFGNCKIITWVDFDIDIFKLKVLETEVDCYGKNDEVSLRSSFKSVIATKSGTWRTPNCESRTRKRMVGYGFLEKSFKPTPTRSRWGKKPATRPVKYYCNITGTVHESKYINHHRKF